MKNKKLLFGIVTTLLSLFIVSGCGESQAKDTTDSSKETIKSSQKQEKTDFQAKLANVIDGESAKFNYDQKEKTVKYLLIDAPETASNQPFSNEAKVRSEALIKAAKVIKVEYDQGQHQDSQKNDLMYVWLDGKLLQETLVKEGLARVTEDNTDNDSQLQLLQKAQTEAKAQKIGIWSVDGYATTTGFDVATYNTVKEKEALIEKATLAVKQVEGNQTRDNYNLAISAVQAIPDGNSELSNRLITVNNSITAKEQEAEQQRIVAEKQAQEAAEKAEAERQAQEQAAAQQANSGEFQYVDANGQGTIKGSRNGIYHVPGSTYYDRTTNPVAMFKTISEAEQAGYRAPKK
ncbi:MAG: thermonuclease family protein [Streptococcaceae bacterium]|jgi:endonuclease YncB( thermonuclease family)|nr:thermonuclease family protein [Streptococcaceae bacterium]MCH4176161.1 thermonuclease family protein [Streptococcaceae bacterium]